MVTRAEVVARCAPAVAAGGRRARRALFVARLKVAAAAAQSRVRVDIADDVDIASTVAIEVWPHTVTTVVIGSRTMVGDRVRLSLRGGRLEIGSGTQIRRFGTYHVGGALMIGAGCVLSTGVVVHCAEAVRIGDLTIIGEYTTVADSAHRRTPPGVPVHHSVRTAPVEVGRNVWVGAHAVLASGCRVGDQCFVGAGAVVTSDIADGWLAVGMPAKPLRPLDEEAEPADGDLS